MCNPIDERVNINGLTDEITKEEFTRLNHSFEFYLDFGLKAVAFFYAAVGGVLSIYFTRSESFSGAIVVLLGIPTLMSSMLGRYFLRGARLWRKHTVYMCQLAGKLQIERPPDVEFLGKLLKAFGALFFVTSAALLLLLSSILIAYWRN